MTNTLKLRSVMLAKGYTQTTIAEKLNRTVQTINNKINNKAEFTLSEMQKLSDILELTSEEREQIFFGHQVE